jgi:type VI secretion system secreted protein VgrG
LLAIETSLGKDKLLLTSLVGQEAISELFSYEVDLLSTDHSISAEQLIGDKVKLVITSDDGKAHAIHGMVAEWRAGPVIDRELRRYRARLVPWLWYLGHSTDCRIFQNLSVPEIIEQVFQSLGCSDYEMSVSREDYPKLEFCVQYRETALNFVCRLMEEVGIFYFFQHDEDRHLMVIADKNVSFKPLPDQQLVYAPNTRRGHVTRWEQGYEFRPGRWAQRDFNFETPSNDLTTNVKTVLRLRNAHTFERYDYPGRYIQKGRGTQLTKTLMETEEAAHQAAWGVSNYPSLAVGGRFTLTDHPCENESSAYVIRRVRHVATDDSHLTHVTAEAPRYDNSFEAIPYNVPFRPPRITEKPFVHGPQTAIVVGPAGEKIHTDKHGRVRVQFHWDRYGKRDERSSCWIRVSHAWAGRGWGSVHLPHIGHEVVVSFLEGDPDRPLITGRVYNGENEKSIKMPDNKTQSGLRDHSGNEILMEGKGGSEDIRINATKDMNVVVTHDYNETVKTGNRKIDIQSGTYTHTVAAKTAERTSKDQNLIKSSEANVQVEAATKIQLHVGASTFTMDDAGKVEIKANDIVLDAKTISFSGQTSVETVGGQVNSTANGTHTIKGALVKIN